MNLYEIIKYGEEKLVNVDNGINEAKYFAEDLFSLSKIDFINAKDIELTRIQSEKYISAIDKRLQNIPYNYIVGFKEFYGRKFVVDERVLVPRYETEIMIDYLEKHYMNSKPERILDLCTGSGVIGITLNKIFNVKTVISDISKSALEVAKINANNLKANVDILESDLFSNINGKFDLITMNPPYVPEDRKNKLQIEIQKYEPQHAIFAGDDGLYLIKKFIDELDKYTEPNFISIIEIDETQKEKLIDYLKNRTFKFEFIKDFQNLNRFLILKGSEIDVK
ncbi:MAG: peptide chain release factor N(5)-glutamine methyltransferase [Ezakiella sp.]|nr:peptide chain release factor N(5)-glutamine methyltransferase [Ezakiella sp.]MDD7471925.1 peptide chain release factor N(5)-glutamine methyltransferase [Bacillota bacterium]MDY3923889.1 peptide chain release factor N(5)-glutamine methyltransferase [Ezakiella sp.]